MDLITIGDVNIDLTITVPRFPKEDDEVQISSIKQSLGGDATNIAVAAAKLGIKTAVISCIGNDSESTQLLQWLSDQHIHINEIQRSAKNKSGLVISIVRNDGQRNLLSHRGANQDLHIGPKQVSIIQQSRAVHISDPIPETENWIISEKSFDNQIISFDPGSITAARGLTSLKPVLEKVKLLFVNETEIELMTGNKDLVESAKRMLSYGPQLIIVKKGAKGCYFTSKEEAYTVPGYKVTSVDSTGAGDAFDAAFLAELLNGQPFVEAAQFANAVGAITCTQYGAQNGLVNRQQVIQFLQSAEIDQS